MKERANPDEYFRAVANPIVFAELFDAIPDVYLFIKDRGHRYMKVNPALARLLGCRSTSEMIGHTDEAFCPPVLAAQYMDEDRRVMVSRRPLLNQIWLVAGADGLPRWYVSSKFPVFGPRRMVIGIAGAMRPHDHAGDAPGDYRRLTPACEFVLAHYGQPIAVADLARCASLSISQLQREFRRLFGMSPGDYILRVRLIVARRKLEMTGAAVGTIALDCGFYDQSHFTRAFRADTGLRPLEYRRRFAPA
ncbi:MAG: AraC family transcriptional regulator [Opitutaceae bacterium]|nr:AraC family transcriptional regulator [Opitutaceae bacterium]